jgi:hypothetical protein
MLKYVMDIQNMAETIDLGIERWHVLGLNKEI